KMEDERTLHPLIKDLPTVDLAPLSGLSVQAGRPRIVLLNSLGDLRGESLKRLLALPGSWTDMAMLEGAAGLERFTAQVGRGRVVLGSHAAFYYAEAAHLKLKESVLTNDQSVAIREGNARRLGRMN